MPKDVSSEVVTLLTSQNTLKILNTIRPVTRAFTVMDAVRPVRASMAPQLVISIPSCPINCELELAIHITRSNKSRSASESRQIYGPKYADATIEGTITTRILRPHTI